MTPYQIIIVREGTWNWVYYLFFVVILCSLGFFLTLFFQSIKLLRSRRMLAQIAAQDGKSFAVNFTIWQTFLGRLLMVIMAAYLIWISFDDGFNGFTSANITPEKVRLNYLWPMPDKEIARREIQSLESKYWGKNSGVLVFMTNNGRKIKSVSGDADEIKSLCKDFLIGLGIVTKIPNR